MFRSYAYLGIHAALIKALQLFGLSKMSVFFFLRAALAAASGLADAVLVHGAHARFGPGVASFSLASVFVSAGTTQASIAFLPSSFTMTLFSLSTGLWLGGRGVLAVAAGAVGVLLGWPFAAVAIVPAGLGMAWDAVSSCCVRRSRAGAAPAPVLDVCMLVASGVVTSAAVLGASVALDAAYYGKLGLAVWEIIKYNALGIGGDGQGADLYGVEPWWWYLANLALNFNAVAALALASPLAVLAVAAAGGCSGARPDGPAGRGCVARMRALAVMGDVVAAALVSATVVGWVALMSGRAHKEERFLFPVYPAMCVAAGLAGEAATQALSGLLEGQEEEAAVEDDEGQGKEHGGPAAALLLNRRPTSVAALTVLLLVASATLSASRLAGQVAMFGAPIRAWRHVWQLTAARGHPDLVTGAWGAIERGAAGLPGGAAAAAAANLTLPDGTRLRRFGEHSDEPFGLRVCVGKEWYRFPAATFLPDATRPHGTDAPAAGTAGGAPQAAAEPWGRPAADPAASSGAPAVLSFLKSGFGGQLPQPFDVLGDRTAALLPGFNDANREEADRYVPPSSCDVIVDLALPGGEPEPWLADSAAEGGDWVVSWEARFAHADTTPRLWRLFWVPGVSDSRVSWGRYVVLRRRGAVLPRPAPGVGGAAAEAEL